MAKRHSNRVGDLESLFLRLEELVLANSGEDEFEEVFKLVIAKLWDERTGKGRFRPHRDKDETYDEISALLREADQAWPGILDPASPSLTPEHLQVCVEALARHTISDAGLEVMDGFFEFLVSKSSKGAKGQYFTPRHVVELCVRMMKPTCEETVLDPACGSGGFLIHALNYVRANNKLTAPGLKRYCSEKLWGFDLDNRAVRVAKTLMVLAGDGSANILRLNSLLRPDMGGLFSLKNKAGESDSILTVEDVCRSRLRKHKGFDLILTNPPFAGEVRERQILDAYTLSRGRTRIERDVLFLERCVQLLRPGGRLAIVLPHNKFAASAWTYAREWLVRHARVVAVIGLGRNTFLPHTHQKASILFVERLADGASVQPDDKVFFAISERDGKDSKGQPVLKAGTKGDGTAWVRLEHDLEEIATTFDEFSRSNRAFAGGGA